MGELQVKLFGGFRLSYNSTPLDTFKTPRLQALLTYLILDPGQAHFRYQIAYAFWPDSSESQARTNLRHLIHLLHKALPDCDRFIDFDTQTLQWQEAGPYSLDVSEFVSLIAPGPGSIPSRDDLDRAVQLYQGDLLPSCYDDWIIPERERLRNAYLSTLESLSEIAENSRDYRTGLDYTRRLLLADPLHTRGNRRLIRLCSLLEDRPSALKAYQAYASLIKNELGIQPDQEMQDLYTYIKDQMGKEASLPIFEAQLPLVGRQGEWQKLQADWRTAKAGNPQIVFVRGEAGIGKTRLVNELVAWSARQGIRTATAYCYPAEGSLPYAPVVSWLRSLPLPQLDPVWLTEISRLLPELTQKYPNLLPQVSFTESWQRLRLFEALARAVLNGRTLQLLLIEDIHWCDQDTLEWLHYLLRFDLQAPVMIVATERSEENLPADHPLQVLKATLAGMGSLNDMELKPLGRDDSLQLAAQAYQSAANQVIPQPVAESIYLQTEGNPLFIVEMIRLGSPLQETADPSNGTLLLSDKVQNILQQRISQVTHTTHELLCLAATIGREFHLEVLNRASEDDPEKIVQALDELVNRRIIQEISPEVYDFTHDRLRQVAFDGLSTAHRRLLHRRVAEAYVALSTQRVDARNAEIAVHYEHAGLIMPAIDYYRKAAIAAASIYANTDAIRYLRDAITLANSLNPGSHHAEITSQDMALLHEALGDLLALSGNYSQALDQYLAAHDQPFDQPPIWESSLYRKISAVQVSLYRHPDAHADLDLAEQCVHGNTDQAARQEWINIQLARGQLYYWDNKPGGMQQVLQNVQPCIEEFGSDEQRLELLSIDYQYYLRLERYRPSQTTIDLALRRQELCQVFGDRSKLAYAIFQVGFALLWGGEVIQAQDPLKTALSEAEAMGNRTLQARCLAYLGISQRKLKQMDPLRSQTEDLLVISQSIGEYAYQGVAWANKAWLAWYDGNEDQTIEFGQAAFDCWGKYPGAYVFHWLALWPMLAVYVAQERLEQADTCASGLLDPNQQPLLETLEQLLKNAQKNWLAGDRDCALMFFQQALQAAQAAGDL